MASTSGRLPVYVAQRGNPIDIDLPMEASASVYLNCFVNTNAAGRLVNGTDAAAQKCAGVGTKDATCSAVAGSTRANARTNVIVEFNINGVTIDATDIGKNASIFDNDTVCDALAAANDVVCGTIVNVENGKAYVRVGVFALTTG